MNNFIMHTLHQRDITFGKIGDHLIRKLLLVLTISTNRHVLKIQFLLAVNQFFMAKSIFKFSKETSARFNKVFNLT